MPLRKIGKAWYIDIYIDGKRIQKRASTNKAIAQRILNKLLEKRDLSQFGIVTKNNVSLQVIKEGFLSELQSKVLPRAFCVLNEEKVQ